MIYGNINNQECLKKLDNKILNAIEYFKNNDLDSLSNGEHIIIPDELFFNKIEYTTTKIEDRFWEAHRKYIDLHIIIAGDERIDVNLIDNMEFVEYVEAEDYVKINGQSKIACNLQKGDFLVLFPEDAHMTCLEVNNQSSCVKKVVFKVLI